ncbi:amino acid dehydrogenase [Desulfosarcina widdelii]|uniref:Amino acid dehydrogenase n=1 Tax=Desulfosarcina widdelii TaxID=947919 RepID=A0A5K7ZBA4_9BACT|nr:FAD-dependent oxidoreductase [Desulfosarcina widdelii]BBO79126.1 amino acid dehydrogenase [Desulfosarcina widdelii]
MNHENNGHSDVLVVGGGVIGLACAWYLARAGKSVRIVEEESVGSGASHGNCGILFFSDLVPLCVPGAISHEMIRLLRGTSPLYIKPRPDPSLAFWLLRFAANCTASQRSHAMRAKDAILRTSMELLDELLVEEKLDCDHDRRGVIMAFTDPKYLEGYAETSRMLEPFGFAPTYHDRNSVRQLEPALSHRICGGWHHTTDSHLRPEALVEAWSRAVRNSGVTIEENCRVKSFETRNGIVRRARTSTGSFSADQFVLATGAWTAAIARQFDLRIPVQPGKGYSITMERPSACPEMPCYLYERNVVVTPWKNGLRLGGTMEFSGFGTDLTQRRLNHLESAAAFYLQTPIGRRVEERWAGLRPMCCDDLPIIGRTPGWDNLLLATGHGMLGVTMAPGTGRLITDLVLGRSPLFDPRPFAVGRFR